MDKDEVARLAALRALPLCRKPGCGAREVIGSPCTDGDCPQKSVAASAYREALDRIAALEADKAEAVQGRDFYADLYARRSAMLSEQRYRRNTLFSAIAHGDEDHRAWLEEGIDKHFAGEPVPAPRGAGRKEARIAELEAELARLRQDDHPARREGGA